MTTEPDYPHPTDRGLTKAEQKELKGGETFWCKFTVTIALCAIISIFGFFFGLWKFLRMVLHFEK
jgi:predicted transcriptional regulator